MRSLRRSWGSEGHAASPTHALAHHSVMSRVAWPREVVRGGARILAQKGVASEAELQERFDLLLRPVSWGVP
jgi:hypothetical protein